MSATDIQAKVRAGLAKAAAAVGLSTSEPVYKIIISNGQRGNPLAPAPYYEEKVLLPNAIFQTFTESEIAASSSRNSEDAIKAGDRKLVTDNTVEITVGDIIRQGDVSYLVVAVDNAQPRSEALVYKSQIRRQ